MLRIRGHHWGIWVAGLLAGVAALALYSFTVWFGALNHDEGWYLYAAQLLSRGQLPYRDFFFTQGPVMPMIYGLLSPLWSPAGVLGGRVLTAILGLLGALLTAGLARRAVPPERTAEAGVLTFALSACNLYHIYFTTIPKTYALANVLLLGGYLCLTLIFTRQKRSRSSIVCMWALPAGFLIAAAACTRASLLLLLPITTLSLLLAWRHTGASFFWFALGGGTGLAMLLGPFMQNSWEPFIFSHTYHLGRENSGLLFMIGSLARSIRGYLPLVLLGVALLTFRIYRGLWGSSIATRSELLTGIYRGRFWPWHWLAAFALLFIAQLATPFPYDDYQVPLSGLLTAALVAWVVQGSSSSTLRSCICLFWTLVTLATSFSSPLLQEWLILRQDRFWVVTREQSDLAKLRSTARKIKELSDNDPQLLTQDLYLAVETGQRVPPGFEMGPFCYFPHLDDQAAQHYKVMNHNLLRALLLSAPTTIVAYSGYGFAIEAPAMTAMEESERFNLLNLLGRNYDHIAEIENFGQHATTLQIMKRRNHLHIPIKEGP